MVAHMVTVPVTGAVAGTEDFTITELDTLEVSEVINLLRTIPRHTIRLDRSTIGLLGTTKATLITTRAATSLTAATSTTSLATTICIKLDIGTTEQCCRDAIVGGCRSPSSPPFSLPGGT